jgi:hypothetical protein
LAANGTEQQNLALEPNIENLTTTTSGTCPGIKGTSEGKLTGLIALNKVKSTVLQPAFFIQAMPEKYDVIDEKGTVTIKNLTGTAQAINRWVHSITPAPSFSTTGENTCKTKTYGTTAPTNECSFTIEFKAPGVALWRVAGANGDMWETWAEG